MDSTAHEAEDGARSLDDDEARAELAELFGETCTSDGDDEQQPPAATKVEQHSEQPQRGILEMLIERKGQLSGTAASIVRDAEQALNRNLDDHNSFASITRKRRQRAQQGPNALSEEQQKKKARNAFAVVGRKPQQGNVRYSYDDSRFSAMRLTDAQYPQRTLHALFENFVVVNIADVPDRASEIRSSQLKEFVLFGCLVKKHSKKTAKNGKKFAVWTLSNLPMHVRGKILYPLTSITCLVFDDAYDALHTQVEGTVLAFRKPQVLPPRESQRQVDNQSSAKRDRSAWSGYCLSVSKRSYAFPIGHAANFGVCQELNSQGEPCGAWFHTQVSTLCHHHTRIKLKRHTVSQRMVINNAERPGPTRDLLNAHVVAPTDLSHAQAPMIRNEKYTALTAKLDSVQQYKLSKERHLAKALESKTRALQSERPRLQAHKDTIAKVREKERALRAASSIGGNPSGGATSTSLFRMACHASNVTRATASGFAKLARRESLRVAPSAQARYNSARDTLIQLGFKVSCNGGFDPPNADVCKEIGLHIQTRGKATKNKSQHTPEDSTQLPEPESGHEQAERKQQPTA